MTASALAQVVSPIKTLNGAVVMQDGLSVCFFRLLHSCNRVEDGCNHQGELFGQKSSPPNVEGESK